MTLLEELITFLEKSKETHELHNVKMTPHIEMTLTEIKDYGSTKFEFTLKRKSDDR